MISRSSRRAECSPAFFEHPPEGPGRFRMPLFAETALIPLPDDVSLFRPIGFAAAFLSMACWVITSIAFTTAGRRYGTTTVNVSRSVIALGLLLAWVWLLSGEPFPFPPDNRILWLAISGITGLAIGDQLIFSAFNRIGPRLTLLILTLAPMMTALIAWPIIREPLTAIGWVGMAVTIAGVLWVISERDDPEPDEDRPRNSLHNLKLGVTLAMTGVVAVSIGNVLAKLGMMPAPANPESGPVDPLIAQDVRMIAGAATIVLMAVGAGLLGRRIGTPPEPDPELRPSRAVALTAIGIGTVLGPVLGIFFFLYSAALIEVAITATIVALTPVAILPFNRMIEGTHPTRRAILGACLGVIGVSILAFGSAGGGETAGSPPPAIESLELAP
jgi:drug/metabolite transporter (DMT)-like permease